MAGNDIMKKKYISASVDGFTFVELLIAMGIIGAVILWFFQMTVSTIGTNMYTERWTVATMYAEQLMEDAYGTNSVGTVSSLTYSPDGDVDGDGDLDGVDLYGVKDRIFW